MEPIKKEVLIFRSKHETYTHSQTKQISNIESEERKQKIEKKKKKVQAVLSDRYRLVCENSGV